MIRPFSRSRWSSPSTSWTCRRRARLAEGIDPVAISAATGEGLGALRARLGQMLPPAEAFDEPPEPAGVVVHRIEAMGDGFSIEPETDGAFRVRGRRIERIAAQTNFEVEESAERFQRDLSRLGIDAELRRAGISPGDIVRIGSTELEWEPQPWERP
jgi:GTPase